MSGPHIETETSSRSEASPLLPQRQLRRTYPRLVGVLCVALITVSWYSVTLPKLPNGVIRFFGSMGITLEHQGPPPPATQTALEGRLGITLEDRQGQATVVGFVDPATRTPLPMASDGQTLAAPPGGGPPAPHPADLAGVRIGSVLHAIDGLRVDSIAQAERALSQARRVITIEFTDTRDGNVRKRDGVELFGPHPEN